MLTPEQLLEVSQDLCVSWVSDVTEAVFFVTQLSRWVAAAFLTKPAQRMVVGEESRSSSHVSQINGLLTWDDLPVTDLPASSPMATDF